MFWFQVKRTYITESNGKENETNNDQNEIPSTKWKKGQQVNNLCYSFISFRVRRWRERHKVGIKCRNVLRNRQRMKQYLKGHL